MVTNEITGTIVVKSMKDELSSISTGNKTEMTIRFTGTIHDSEKQIAKIESFVVKGLPDDLRVLMEKLNLDTIDEKTALNIARNTQDRLDDKKVDKPE